MNTDRLFVGGIAALWGQVKGILDRLRASCTMTDMDPLLAKIDELLRGPGLAPETQQLLQMAFVAQQTGVIPPLPRAQPGQRRLMGRVEISLDKYLYSKTSTAEVTAEELRKNGFPMDVPRDEIPLESYDDRMEELFREAAKKIGATWWTFLRNNREMCIVIEWGTEE